MLCLVEYVRIPPPRGDSSNGDLAPWRGLQLRTASWTNLRAVSSRPIASREDAILPAQRGSQPPGRRVTGAGSPQLTRTPPPWPASPASRAPPAPSPCRARSASRCRRSRRPPGAGAARAGRERRGRSPSAARAACRACVPSRSAVAWSASSRSSSDTSMPSASATASSTLSRERVRARVLLGLLDHLLAACGRTRSGRPRGRRPARAAPARCAPTSPRARAVTRSSGRSMSACATAASTASWRNSSSICVLLRVLELVVDVGAQLVERVELARLGGEVVVELG